MVAIVKSTAQFFVQKLSFAQLLQADIFVTERQHRMHISVLLSDKEQSNCFACKRIKQCQYARCQPRPFESKTP